MKSRVTATATLFSLILASFTMLAHAQSDNSKESQIEGANSAQASASEYPFYVVANYAIAPDMLSQYAEYPALAGKSLSAFEGEILVATKATKSIEGEPHGITVVIRFPTERHATNWYESEEYSAIKPLRTKTMTAGWLALTPQFHMK